MIIEVPLPVTFRASFQICNIERCYDMNQETTCPECGRLLPKDAPRDLCPECLLRQAGVFLKKTAAFLGQEKASIAPGGSGPPDLMIGQKIGRYRLTEVIGEGGCGIVYSAEQEDPVRRRVALKVIKLGMDTKQVMARFEAERQALAMMDHPNIAKVFDAGATESGRPYFVMELVAGAKITDFCDERHLTVAQRLELFVHVCQAVQHAHQKGIIHRDIKPSNILVVAGDGAPVVKVIDFGIAKATEAQLTDEPFFTVYQQFVGTPVYMSPEQANLSTLDIDTRSDIYSSGVLLYEMLTGRMPFDMKLAASVGIDEMRRTVRETEPIRPSACLMNLLPAELQAVARRRSVEPSKLIRLVGGDLDWIIMMALEKDRDRRYQTANGLAMDIQRHLQKEPVVARPPSRMYQLQKLVKRNWPGFIAALAVLLALIAGAGVSSWHAVRATRARDWARRAQQAEAIERQRAQERLYDSLVREARATRLARRAGYRDEVLRLLEQARSLDVPNKDPAELRREAMACLGDFAGLTPVTISNFVADVTLMCVQARGELAAFALQDSMVSLRSVPSGTEIDRLKVAGPVRSLDFDRRRPELLTVSAAPGQSEPRPASPLASELTKWAPGQDGKWAAGAKISMPGAYSVMSSDRGVFVASAANHVMSLMDLDTMSRIELRPAAAALDDFPEAAVRPDGRFLAAEVVPGTSNLAAIGIWDLMTGDQVRRIELQFAPPGIAGISFSPDGRYLACLAGDEAAVYEVGGFARVAGFRGESFEAPSRACFTAGSSVISIPIRQQSAIRLWDWAAGEDVVLLKEPIAAAEALFVSDGRYLLTHGSRHARLYQCKVEEELVVPRHLGGTAGVVFNPGGQVIASVGKDQWLTLRDSTTGDLLREAVRLPAPGQSAAFSADGRLLAVSSFLTETVWIWNAITGEKLLELGSGAPATVWSAEFSPDGKFFAVACEGSGAEVGIKIWQLNQSPGGPLEARLFRTWRGGFWGLTFAPDSRRLAFSDYGSIGGVYGWDYVDAAAPRLIESDRASYLQCENFTPDSRHLVFLSASGQIVTLDLATGRAAGSFPIQSVTTKRPPAGLNLCLSPDGSKVAVSSRSRTAVDVWDMKTGKLLYALPEQIGTVWWLAWSSDSQRLAISRSDGRIGIWKLEKVDRILAQLGL